MWHCHYCRLPLSIETQAKHQLCPGCGSDIHSCKNCLNFEEHLPSPCREPNSDWVADRAATNTCPFFEFRPTSATPTPAPVDNEAEKAKEAFRALFRNA